MGKEHIEFVFDDAKATIISRGEERDQPDGERTIPRCVTAFNAITGHNLSNCDGWLFMEVLKKCRSVQGAYKYDDFRDGVGYAALRAEEARMENEDTEERAERIEDVMTGPCVIDHRITLDKKGITAGKSVVYDSVVEATEEAIREVTRTEPEVALTGPCVTDYQRALRDNGITARPGQVFEICKHGLLECEECELVLGDTRTAIQIQQDSDNRELRRIDG